MGQTTSEQKQARNLPHTLIDAEVLERRAASGDAASQTDLGLCLLFGHGRDQNTRRAIALFAQAAEQNYAEAQYRLALCYFRGWGIRQDRDKAEALLKAASEQGHEMATGWCLSEGYDGRLDKAAALKTFKKTAELGDAEGLMQLYWCYETGTAGGVKKDEAKAFKYLEAAAELGHGTAMSNLGSHYALGLGTTQNRPLALKYFQKSADTEYSAGLQNLSSLYRQGNGVPRDQAKAFELSQKASDLGEVSATFSLAVHYLNGFGVAENLRRACHYFEQCAAQGLPLAGSLLSSMLREGVGVAKDARLALYYLHNAFDQLLADGTSPQIGIYAYTVGSCYESGHGTPVDIETALHYYKMGHDKGVRGATEAIRRLTTQENQK